jgi:hypothetical protein
VTAPSLSIYQRPLPSELVEITVPCSPVLAAAPVSAVVWLERHGVTTEHPATLQPGATTALSVVVWDPSGRVLEAGQSAYRLTVRLRDAGGTHIARSEPVTLTVLAYPAAPV